MLPEHDGRQGFNGYLACSSKAQSLWSGAAWEVQDWLAVDWFATVRQLDLLAGMALSLDGVRVELASAIPVMCHGFCGDSPLVAHRTEFVSLTTEMNAPQLALRRVFQMTIAVQPVLWHILIPEDDIMVVKAIGFKVVDSSVTAWAEGLRGSHSPIVAK